MQRFFSQESINIPINFLNSLIGLNNGYSLTGKEHISSSFGANGKLEDYLFAAGVEETIHHFQNTKHEKVKARLSLIHTPTNMSHREYLMTSFEVEARAIADQILYASREVKYWEPMDSYLKNNYPDRYGKTDIE